MHYLCSPFLQTISYLPVQLRRHNNTVCRRRNKNKKWWVSAMEKESKFEVDQEKARQALSELDQQLESLSLKQVNPPKIRATSFIEFKERTIEEEPPEITGSFLGYTAFVLFAFTIFYNILFITVIQPSIDVP